MKNAYPSMKTYQWILFDADETLFRFDAFSGLRRMFARHNIIFNETDFASYQVVNKALWAAYQRNEINAEQLRERRFAVWEKRLNIPAQQLEHAFEHAMLDICKPLEGAAKLLDTLKGKVKLGIITNGFSAMQQKRLERTGFHQHIDLLVISEEVGFAKPHPVIFDHALANMGQPERSQVLIVGDSLESDIAGGRNAGFETCWLNPDNKPALPDIQPHYQIRSLLELEQLFANAFAELNVSV